MFTTSSSESWDKKIFLHGTFKTLRMQNNIRDDPSLPKCILCISKEKKKKKHFKATCTCKYVEQNKRKQKLKCQDPRRSKQGSWRKSSCTDLCI